MLTKLRRPLFSLSVNTTAKPLVADTTVKPRPALSARLEDLVRAARRARKDPESETKGG